jgi:MYXO-CTERM domain-containing protein
LDTVTTLPTPLSGGDNLLVDTLVTSATGALNQSISFTVGSGVTGLSGSAAWQTSSAVDNGPRLIGVNISILDSSNTLVVSDAFQGTIGGYATSTFNFGNLAPGTYSLLATGTGVRDSSLDISLSFTGATPPEPFAVPQTVPVPTGSLISSTTVAQPLVASDTLFLNTLVTGQTGALSQSVGFTVGAGVTDFTGAAAWAVSTADSTGPRLLGVNIDIFDSSNALVFSDSFVGTQSGFAFSSLAGVVGPGSYTLVATGNAVRDASLNVSLTFNGTTSTASVPAGDASTALLFLAALGAIAVLQRRRK